CRFGDSADFHQDFLFTEDEVLLAVDIDVDARVFAEEDAVTDFHIECHAMAFFNLASSDGHYFTLMRFFFRRIGDNDPAFRGRFLLQPAYEDAIVQRSDIHGHFFVLRSIHSKTRTINFWWL